MVSYCIATYGVVCRSLHPICGAGGRTHGCPLGAGWRLGRCVGGHPAARQPGSPAARQLAASAAGSPDPESATWGLCPKKLLMVMGRAALERLGICEWSLRWPTTRGKHSCCVRLIPAVRQRSAGGQAAIRRQTCVGACKLGIDPRIARAGSQSAELTRWCGGRASAKMLLQYTVDCMQ